MSILGILFFLVCCVLVFSLPRERAVIPLFIACLHISYGQGVSIGGAYFTVIRLLIVVVMIRITSKGEWAGLEMTKVDRWMISWLVCLILTSFFHRDIGEALKYRFGMVLTAGGMFWVVRALVRTWEECGQLMRTLAIILVPLAALMLYERFTGRNLYSIFGGVPLESMERNGKIRAAGPFLHPILAGTAGATLFPLLVGLWKIDRKRLLFGGAACMTMIFASASSGPIMSLAVALFGLALWNWRQHLRKILWVAFFSLLFLHFAMRAPVWWLMARVDFTGSSTGFFRAALIDSAIEHSSEWILAGTDITRHWMPTGVTWSEEQTDITNYFLNFGIMGGLPTMIAFMGILWSSFTQLHRNWHFEKWSLEDDSTLFLPWALGCSLFSHAITFLSVAYFDQTMVLWFATVALCTCYPETDSEITAGFESFEEEAIASGVPI